MPSNNANEPAFPETPLSGGKQGLTKREYFAGLAMQADLMANEGIPWKDGGPDTDRMRLRAKDACLMADALLAELEKTDGK